MLRASVMSLALLLAASTAAAQGASGSLEGRTVKGAGGVVLGVVEKVIYGADGHPAQVLVRPKGPRPAGPHSLAFNGLVQTAEGLSTPLTKAEFDSMPTVNLDPN